MVPATLQDSAAWVSAVDSGVGRRGAQQVDEARRSRGSFVAVRRLMLDLGRRSDDVIECHGAWLDTETAAVTLRVSNIVIAPATTVITIISNHSRRRLLPPHRRFCSKVLTRFDPLQSPSGRPWTSHANPMSLVLLNEDVKDVCELGGATNKPPSDARSLAPRTSATCQ